MGVLHELFISLKLEDETDDGLGGIGAKIGILSGFTSALTTKFMDLAEEIAGEVVDAVKEFVGEVVNLGLQMDALSWRTKAMFGDTADYIIQRSEDISKALNGLYSGSDINKLMTQGGMMFSSMGFGDKEIGNLTQAAAAMGTIKGTSPQDAMSAITAAMGSGRTTQLKSYGVNLADISQDKTPQEKEIAIYNAINDQLGNLTKTAATFADTGPGRYKSSR